MVLPMPLALEVGGNTIVQSTRPANAVVISSANAKRQSNARTQLSKAAQGGDVVTQEFDVVCFGGGVAGEAIATACSAQVWTNSPRRADD
jgi:hypothetical protein